MGEALEEIQDEVQEHGRDSQFHGFIAAFVAVGFLYGLAGFFKWSLHSDLMARLLG